MSYLILGFITGMSLILAIGAQNIFVIEQGLKKNYIFLVCLICSISDFLLIFLGIFIFNYFQEFVTLKIHFILNFLLFIFLLYFIWTKVKTEIYRINTNLKRKSYRLTKVIFKTLSFTYLNPHVYSDTVFFLGNFSKDFTINQKIYFGLGASISSALFFFLLGYLSNFLSTFLQSKIIWKSINIFIIAFMSALLIYVFMNLVNSYTFS